jgi:mono/diheme cytochrome c family protein
MKNFLFVLIAALLVLNACKKDDDVAQPVVSDYDKADVVRGGILYDKFWSTEANYTGADAATIGHLNRKSDFYRCKQCHAWDLMGNQGSYNSRKPSTSRPNIAGSLVGSKSKTAQQLFDAMKITGATRRTIADSVGVTSYDPATNAVVGDKMPDYSKLLSDAQIWDIVKFIKEGAMDVTVLYDATYTGAYPNGKAVYSNIGKDGNATNGKSYYTTNCASCHGTDGKLISNLDATVGMTAGKFIRTKPNEAQHKLKYGQLGSVMKSIPSMTISNVKDLYKALADTVTFPN